MAEFLPTGSLDFTAIRTNLRSYLKQQAQFQDYDFEGSNLSVLLDLLAYNSYLNGFYLNMIGSEMFLDTATLRDSIVSHAKELNYTPRSYSSAIANIRVRLSVSNNAVSSVVVPQGTKFTGTGGSSGTYTFSTGESTVIFRNNDVFEANVNVYEGYTVQEKFIVTANTDQRFVISNAKVDIDSLIVTVLNDQSATVGTAHALATSLYGLNANSEIYFIQGAENNKYELVFGDGIFGKKPTTGNVIQVDYRISSGSAVNGISNFAPVSTIAGYTATVTAVNSPASDGSEEETAESIKFNAPRHFQTQERAITNDDYKTLILNNFSSVKSLNIFGGEEKTDTPSYGRVFISPVSQEGNILSDALKQEIVEYLKQRSVFSINPVIIDPDYTYLILSISVNYNINLTASSVETINALVRNTVTSYSNQNLEAFNKNFRASRLSTSINSADTTTNSIISNEITSLFLRKDLKPNLLIPLTATLDFGSSTQTSTVNPLFDPRSDATGNALIHDRVVYSSFFTFNGNSGSYLQDDGLGNLVIISTSGTTKSIAASRAGTVDYNTGLVKISGITISDYAGSTLKVYAKARNKDVFSNKNTVLSIDDSELVINSVAVYE